MGECTVMVLDRSEAAIFLVSVALCACGVARNDDAPGAAGDGSVSADAASTSDASKVPDATTDSSAAPDAPLASDLSIGEIAIFQTVRVSLERSGTPVAQRNAPVVAGKAAEVRVYVERSAAYNPRAVTAELVLSDPGHPDVVLTDTKTIVADSTDDDGASLFMFVVPAASVTPTVRFAARLTEADGTPAPSGTAVPSRFPGDGSFAPLGAALAGDPLQVMLVPVAWTGDGSNRVPDTTPAQLALYASVLETLYPIVSVNLTVHAPITYGALTLTGSVNFSGLNQALVSLRTADNAPDDGYYYAVVNAADTFDDYCGSSCVTGQSYVVTDPTDSSMRVGSGVGFSGEDSAWTMAHELGHQHGRTHAPCGVTLSDPNYPYAGAEIGVWGWDSRSATYLAATTTFDLMSYCDPLWISDYTYAALFERLQAVQARPVPRAAERAIGGRFVQIEGDGTAIWGLPLRTVSPPRGTPRIATFRGARGAVIATELVATWELSDSATTTLLLPDPLPNGTATIDVAGFPTRIRPL